MTLHRPMLRGAGHRTPQTLLLLDERDKMLIEARNLYCVGMSTNAAADYLHAKLSRSGSTAWQCDRVEDRCPPRLAGRLDALLWYALKSHDHAPSARLIRLVL